MRILLSNDDGIDAPGLALLAGAAGALSDDVWIVAPERKWTAASHQLSFDRDLTLQRRTARAYACSGAPADCVIAAMTIVCAGQPPDLVLSGINDKRNVGEDAAYSGTIAIAREATFHGVPAIALSRSTRWTDGPAEIAALRRLLAACWHSRDAWARDAHWLAMTLPDALPAPIIAARAAHDKIGGATDVIERNEARIVYRLRRGRPGLASAGDENGVLQAGAITVARQGWRDFAPLADDLAERWTNALTDDEAVA